MILCPQLLILTQELLYITSPTDPKVGRLCPSTLGRYTQSMSASGRKSVTIGFGRWLKKVGSATESLPLLKEEIV